MRKAAAGDLEALVALMGEFYAEAGYPSNQQRSAEAFAALLSDERLGTVWLIQSGGHAVGYLVVTLGYSMEYGGADAFIDDLFVRPGFRNIGLGSAAVEEARAFCLTRGVRALHLEAEKGNVAAQHIYRRAGFRSHDRELLTLQLSAPAPRILRGRGS